MKALKFSRQRESIRECLKNRKDHPTADAVYVTISKEYPKISLGTVYRNLSFLVENGMAIKVPCSDGSVHFDGNVNPHYHFQCTECGAVIDLEMDGKSQEKAFINSASKNFGGTIDGNVTFFYGKCPHCVNKE